MDVDALLDALAGALVAFSAGMTSVPPRTAAHVPDRGLLGAMVGHVPGAGLGAKLVSVFPQNDQQGLPSHQALIAIFDETDGTPIAVMDGTYITAIRTGGAAAVAARVLAREGAKVLAILGAGVQGGSHLETFPRTNRQVTRWKTLPRLASCTTVRMRRASASICRCRHSCGRVSRLSH